MPQPRDSISEALLLKRHRVTGSVYQYSPGNDGYYSYYGHHNGPNEDRHTGISGQQTAERGEVRHVGLPQLQLVRSRQGKGGACRCQAHACYHAQNPTGADQFNSVAILHSHHFASGSQVLRTPDPDSTPACRSMSHGQDCPIRKAQYISIHGFDGDT